MDDSATCPAAPSSDRNKILAAKIEKSKNWTDGVKAGEKNASTNIEAKMNYCFIRTIKSFIATIFLNRAGFRNESCSRDHRKSKIRRSKFSDNRDLNDRHSWDPRFTETGLGFEPRNLLLFVLYTIKGPHVWPATCFVTTKHSRNII